MPGEEEPKNIKEQISPTGVEGHRRHNMHYGASKVIFQKAKELRKFPTHEEEIIWGYLCRNKLGVKFRRQHPIFLYIVDFYCHSLKLVIEIDGGIHHKPEIRIYDAA